MNKINVKPLFAHENELLKYASEYPTPFHLYDEKTIRDTCQEFKSAFSWAEGFTNYFAVKSLPNPHILKILKEEGFGVDCSSFSELVLSEQSGFSGEEIFFTSNNTPLNDFKKAKDIGAIINLDDISHIEFIHESIGLPNYICFRYNPGSSRSGNIIIGDPKSSKFGLTRDQIFEAYDKSKALGVKRFALHTMVLSNCLNELEILENAKMIFKLVLEIKEKTGIRIETVNLGGGIGIPYKPDDKKFDITFLSQQIQLSYKEIIIDNGLKPIKITFECGRYITGTAGCILTRIIHQKTTYKNFIGVDACMANLMRPALYNAYHHLSLIKDPKYQHSHNLCRKKVFFNQLLGPVFDVVGSLCENNDKFACNRYLGDDIQIGDLIVIHDTGAHGHSMGFNYNGKLRSAEYLRNSFGKLTLIRRAETLDDLFATLNL